MPEAGNILSDEFVVDLRRLLEWFARQPAGASLNAGGMPPRERWPDNLTWIGQGVLVDPANRSDPDTGDALPVYTDARYCFDLVRCSSADGDARGLPAFAAVTDDAAISGGTATNLAELVAGTHTLVAGTYVQVFRLFDAGDPAKKRYYFSAGDGIIPECCWGKATANWVAGNLVVLDPCAENGTDIAGGTNVDGYLVCPRAGARSDPNNTSAIVPDILQGDVLAYWPFTKIGGGTAGIILNAKWKASAEGNPPLPNVPDAAHPWIKVLLEGADAYWTLKHKGPAPMTYAAGTVDCACSAIRYIEWDRRGHIVKVQYGTGAAPPTTTVTTDAGD